MIPIKGGSMMRKAVFLFILALLLVSCAPPLRVSYFQGARHYPPTSPSQVDLLREEPRRPHEAFAEIRYNPPTGMSRSQVDWNLRERGAAIGADALVVEIDTVYREQVWVGPYRANRSYRGRRVRRAVVRDHIIEAIAIRYR
jgi:hypothetical protein